MKITGKKLLSLLDPQHVWKWNEKNKALVLEGENWHLDRRGVSEVSPVLFVGGYTVQECNSTTFQENLKHGKNGSRS